VCVSVCVRVHVSPFGARLSVCLVALGV
jgi:hypothetical protein